MGVQENVRKTNSCCSHDTVSLAQH